MKDRQTKARPRGKRRAVAVAAMVLGMIVLAGCASDSKQKWLSIFFDGVPDPNAPRSTNQTVVQLDEDGRPLAGGVFVPSTNFAKVKPPTFTYHPPYEEKKCAECHESRFSVKMKGPQLKVCFECHDDFLEKLKFKHQPAENGECHTCHDPHGSPFPKMVRRTGKALCTECHDDPSPKPKFVHTPFENGECASCHLPHASANKGLLAKSGSAFCFECHDDFLAKSKFKHQPDENGECLACHAPHASPNKFLLAKKGKASCFECHDNFFEKAKFVHSAADDCASCHTPHKATAAKLLLKNTQELCLECHEMPEMIKVKGHAQMGNTACITCHDPHVSDNKFLLKPAALKAGAGGKP